MLKAKLADRLARDIPTMTTDELNLTIEMTRDWAAEVAYADDPETARSVVSGLMGNIKAELERRTPKEATIGA